ncbi:alpha amylase catalytic region [Paenibacillus vortex V453]|uniref:Alpha-amylase n=1 Tax=Paenibacillus vortex V453 TaxID=715225 RepID=A0A2R9T073_9BACL|nr:alpha-glucosidase [Paenibacillus vortex]EFU42998.1 alpha amylase catalytic region [Paenibacillus vortex V453]
MHKVWWKEAVAYEIYPRSFMDSNGDGIGDLQGVMSRLDYLKDLGIDIIWICPIYRSSNDDNGYDISDYQDIMTEFGSMADFDLLMTEIHKRGMRIIMDLVINHTSDEHPWFIESRSSRGNPKRDYYIWRDARNGAEPNNWESVFTGSAWEYDAHTEQYYLHLYSKKQPDLNMENPMVRHDLVRMIRWWLDKGIDGFRVDAITHIKKLPGLPDMPNPNNLRYVDSNPGHRNIEGIHEFLQQFKREAFADYDIMTVGEASGIPITEADRWIGETSGALNMIFQFEHVNLDFGPEGRWDYATWDLAEWKRIMNKWQTGLEGVGWNALYLENHDQPRSVSRFGDPVHYHKESSKMLATFFMLMQGTPFIYQGQEIGMTNVEFAELSDYRDVEIYNYYRERLLDGKDVSETMRRIAYRARDNARTPMQWDDTLYGGFSTVVPWIRSNPNYHEINVEQQLTDPDSILNYYKALIRLRKSSEVLIYGKYQALLQEHPEIFAYSRTLGKESYLIVLNFYGRTTDFQFPAEWRDLLPEVVLSNYDRSDRSLNQFTLKPYEAIVYRVN